MNTQTSSNRLLFVLLLTLASQGAWFQQAKAQENRTGGTKLVRIYDPLLKMPAYSLQIPENWQFEGTILRTKFGDPVITFRTVSGDGLLGTQLMPLFTWAWTQNPMVRGVLKNAGIAVRPPMTPGEFLTQIAIPEIRPGATNVTPLADANGGTAQQGPQGQTMRAGHVRLQTSLNGVPVDEILECSVKTTPQGLRTDMQATVVAYHSPRGKLDSSGKLLLSIGPTMKPNPAWQQAEAKFMSDLSARVNRMSAENNARIVQEGNRSAAAIRRQGESIVAQGQAQSNAFHEMNAQFAEHMGDRQTMVNPTTGATGQVSNQFNYGYANQSGQVVQTNSTTYDPNAQLPGVWTQLQPSKPQ